jgi:glycosyltransferase involved in cell wall biosynthesis
MPFAVAVVVPTFNRADLLAETLAVILKQTHRPAEVIVVDDGSATDATEKLVDRLGPPVKYLKVPNGGPSAARNAGVRASSAEWVAFCDDDDLWTPNYLARAAALVGHTPDVQSVFSDLKYVRDGVWDEKTKFADAPPDFWDGDFVAVGSDRVYRESRYRRVFAFNPVYPSNTVLRRSAFDALGGYDPALSRLGPEDWEFTLRLMDRPPVGVLWEPLVGIRKHAQNRSGALAFMNDGRLTVLRYILENHPQAAGDFRPVVEEQLAVLTATGVDLAFSARQMARVRELYAQLPPAHRTLKRQVKRLLAGVLPSR